MEYKLNTNWCLWYHSINDNKWSQSSYKKLLTITNLYGLKAINDIIQPIHLQNGMFFLMRENIFPTWEDPDNREGCCVSFKISGSVLKEQWYHIISEILTENIFILSDNIDTILENFSDREEYIVRERYGLNRYSGYTDGRSLHEIGFDEGISQERVRQILNRTEMRMRCSSLNRDSESVRNSINGIKEYYSNMEN